MSRVSARCHRLSAPFIRVSARYRHRTAPFPRQHTPSTPLPVSRPIILPPISKPSLIGVLRFAAHLEMKEYQHAGARWRWGWQRTCPIPTAIRSTLADASSNPPAKRSIRQGKRSLSLAKRSIQPGKRSLPPAKRSIEPGKRSLPPAKRSIHPGKRSIPPPNRSIPAATYSLHSTPCLATNYSSPNFKTKPDWCAPLRCAFRDERMSACGSSLATWPTNRCPIPSNPPLPSEKVTQQLTRALLISTNSRLNLPLINIY